MYAIRSYYEHAKGVRRGPGGPGRRRLLVGALLMNAAGIGLFYNGSGWWVVPGWIGMMAGFVSADVMFGASYNFV